MPKTLLKVAAALIAVFLVVVGMVAIALPRLINSDGFQATLREAAEKAVGAPVEWQSIDAGILPARVTIHSPIFSTAAADSGDARFAATSVELRLALIPILQSRIEVSSLVLHGAEIVVTRTAEGLILPLPVPSHVEETGEDNREIAEAPAASSSFELAIRRVTVSDSRIILHDRTLSPPVDWRIDDIGLQAGARISSASLAIEMSARIQSDEEKVGRVEVTGDVELDGSYALEVEIDELLVAALAPYLEGLNVAGELSGRVSIAGDSSDPSKVDLDVSVEKMAVQAVGIDLRGRLRLRGSREGDEDIVLHADLDLDDGGSAELNLSLGLAGQGPIRIDGDLRLPDGGRLDVDGTTTPEGRLDLSAKIDSLDLEIAKPFLPDPKMELGGLATGTARLVGPAQAPETVELDVHVASGLLRVPDYVVEGPYSVKLKINGPLSSRPRGRIDVDLTAARLEYQGQFNKRAGMRAEMTTEFSPNESGEIQFESRIKFRDINEILLQGSVGETTSVAIGAAGFDLKGWSEIFPALEPYAPEGIISFAGLGVESAGESPSRFRGRIDFERVELVIPEEGRVQIQGSILGVETRLETKGLQLSLGGVTFGVQGRVEDPFGSRKFVVAFETVGEAEANGLFSALSSAKDTVYGDLQLTGRVGGVGGVGGVDDETGGDGDLYSTLEGTVQLSIGENGGGRLRGISILQTVLDQFPIIRGAARLARPFGRGKSIDDYVSEEFEVIRGDFEIGDGQVNAKTLRLVYDGYEANLTGPIQLPSFEIDMTGDILLKADLVSALGGLLGTRVGDGKPVRIPLARVTNTLEEPKIKMTAKTLAAVPELLFKATGLETLTLGVGRALGRALGGDGK